MKSLRSLTGRILVVIPGVLLLIPMVARAFPPAPYHCIYGLIRNEFGEPLAVRDAKVVVEAQNGVQVTTVVQPGLEPGANYSIHLSMDAGISPDRYKPTALRPTLPFRILVKVGETTYLPIEMGGNYGSLGEPAGSTRIDLTLGIDSDHDGLPDDWERLLIARLGGGSLEEINPRDDADKDGISNLDEYLAGTFAFDPSGGFRLNLLAGPSLQLEFMVIKPRTYVIYASADLVNWTPVLFRIPGEDTDDTMRSSYFAGDVRVLRVEPVLSGDTPASELFLKVKVD